MHPTAARLALLLLASIAGASLVAITEEIRFADVTAESGLREPLDGMMAHAAAWGDVDGDGDIDLYVGGFNDRPDEAYRPARGPVPNRLFRNLSNGRFEVVAGSDVELHGRTSHAVFVDLDNDGMLDLYVASNTWASSRLPPGVQRDAQLRRSALFRNNQGTFIDASAGSGDCLTAPGRARTIGVFDYDADGLLDLMVLEDRFGSSPRSRLCRNLGDFRFADVTRDAGLPGDLFGLGLATADLNEDGRPDIFVSHSNRLFLSGRGGGYVEPSGPRATLAWQPMDDEDWPAGAVFSDLNRDGHLDLIVGIHHERARNRVYLNNGLRDGVPRFRDVSAEVGLPARLTTKSPHVEVQDFDNDGWPDLYFSSAWIDAAGGLVPLVYRSLGVQGDLPRFEPVPELAEETPLVYFPAGPSGDYDNDGRVDLMLANWFSGNHSRLLRNMSRSNRWLEVGVLGTTMNRMGIGAKVRVYSAGQLGRLEGLLGFQEIGTGYGYSSGQAAIAHFGLGDRAEVDVAVEFPDGASDILRHARAGQRLIVAEP
jgi:hypothetical protein